jgi:Xaa-Pro aminopeptidase
MSDHVVFRILMIFFMLGAFVLAQEQEENNLKSPKTFAERREALLQSLGEGIAVLYSQGIETGTGYRADGNFWYLTGVDDRGAILLLAPQEQIRQVLFLPPRDIEIERWIGQRPSINDSLRHTLGFEEIMRTGELDEVLISALKHTTVLQLISSLAGPAGYIPPDLDLYQKIMVRVPGTYVKNSSQQIETMRMVKSAAELSAIENAVQVTYLGITDMLAGVRPGVKEYQLDGILENSFKRQGAQQMSFDPIIGTGEESTILHYQKRDCAVEPGQLLLVDVGAEWEHYAADITRTFPVDGKFNPEQAHIYDVVLNALKSATGIIKPGITTRDVEDRVRTVIREAGYIDALIHGTCHHLGLDVHDVADYGMKLKPGMVVTVEPGIYFPDKKFGVRIEDDVLITESGHRILSEQIPRERSAVEAWIISAKR